MRKNLSYLLAFLMANIICIAAVAQVSTINGSVKNNVSGEAVSAVSITVKGSGSGTFTDSKGNFRLLVNKPLPLTIIVTSVGYELKEVVINSASDFATVNIIPTNLLGQEVVIAATRTPSRILESPVTIERVSAAAIRNSASPAYYDIVGNLKGVDVVTASLNFKTPSTRGFNGSGNLRLNQIVDGMDNQAPGLNFSLGSVVGLTELDVESMELLPGASSALYGPGGMNGALVINSKNPFKYQGFSLIAKTGIMHTDGRERSPSAYYNWSMRWAKKVSDKFAFKIGGELIQAKDWLGDDYRDYQRLGTTGAVKPGTRDTDPNYDGVNIYGDETTVDIKSYLNGLIAPGNATFYAPYVNALPSSIPVSRTGYTEKEVVDPNTVNLKLSGAIDFKLTSAIDLIVSGYWGTGNTVYTGSDRYSLKDLKMGQYKIELNNPNWFVRAYTTQENAGESFNATVTTRLFNEAWKKTVTFDAAGKPAPQPSDWLVQYAETFLANKLGGQSDITAHNNARIFADQGRPAAGSATFNELFDKVRSIPISDGGGLFVDKTNLYNIEGQYNFSDYTHDFADIIVGANYKRYVLNSEGTLFADSAGKIGINEVGGYVQATRRMLDNRLKLIGSVRYDKNQNFDGKFTPRISAVITVAQDNNIRLSYQTAYRFGSTQQQWIDLRVGGGTALIGGLQDFKDFYRFNTNPVYFVDDLKAGLGSSKTGTFDKFKAETVNSFEGGYKGLLMNKKLLIDIYGYYGIYKDFIARTQVAQSVTGNASVFDPSRAQANLVNSDSITVYSVPTNIKDDVKTYGFGMSLEYSLPLNFLIGATFSSDDLQDVPPNFIAAFNSPKFRVGGSLGNTGFLYKKRVGFNVNWRWQDKVDYQGDFANGEVPAYHTLDGQVSYRFTAQKILVKLGGSNLLNQYYRNGFGNATIGGLYYVSIGYNLN